MIKLLQLLWLGYQPTWKIIRTAEFHKTRDGVVTHQGVRYVLQCEQTGKLKQWETS